MLEAGKARRKEVEALKAKLQHPDPTDGADEQPPPCPTGSLCEPCGGPGSGAGGEVGGGMAAVCDSDCFSSLSWPSFSFC